jgi:hypothetical protein
MEKKWLLVGGVVFVIVILAVVGYFAFGNKTADGKYDSFAKCLTERGVKMYGADWCSHCKNQKEMFGTSFQFVNYVECAQGSGQSPACAAAGIKGYPTWEFKDGSRQAGEVPLEKLSERSGCKLEA